MKLQGLAKLTLLDYPGRVACTVFFAGCNFRCPFCHNAGLVLEPDANLQIDAEEFFLFLEKRKGILDGVCITGGEPLLQPQLAVFIRNIRSRGFAVKLDTNGSLPERLDMLLEEGLIDYVAMDLKNSQDLYAKTAGVAVDLEKIRHSIALIMEKAPDYEFRTTVVSGYHTPQSISQAAQLISGAKRYFLQAFVDSGSLILPGLSPCTPQQMERMAEAARNFVTNTQLRGV